jgi:DNA (cytosine-5)-methyltransferase 1
MRYGSVCSGVESATVGWHPLGWQAQFFSEIEAAPRAVLKHRWPEVPLHGDFTTIRAGQYGPTDLLVGGTPCQSFSVAGLRGGLADERGNLALEFLRLAHRLRPRWLAWENVPGVLSSNGGRDFGAILGGMVELGYGFAYRVLDAQFVRVDGHGRAVPQRRRRVFVVGHLGDWRRPAAVLFERQSLRGDPAPRREAGKRVATSTAPSLTGSGRGVARSGESRGQDPLVAVAFGGNNTVGPIDVATAVRAKGGTGHGDFESETFVAHSFVPPVADPLCANEQRTYTHEGCTFRTRNVLAFDTTQITHPENRCRPESGGPCHPLASGGHPPAIAFQPRIGRNGRGYDEDAVSALNGADAGATSDMRPCVAYDILGTPASRGAVETDIHVALRARQPGASEASTTTVLTHGWAVRRLTPRECERLQGMPDDYTLVPFGKKLMADGPRYKMLGNAMAANVMRWIGRRIEMVEDIAERAAA